MIEQSLARLIGQPLWAVGRAGSVVWFQFGERHPSDQQGGPKELGAYAIHLDCPWSWERSWGEVIVDDESDHDELSELLVTPIICESIEGRDNGSFRIRFDDNTALVVAVEADPDPTAEEYWRFFQPHLDTPHFVVGSRGVEGFERSN